MSIVETKRRTKSALSYFGSDSEVAGELARFFDSCSHVTIAFCGGLSILPEIKARSIVANDLNDNVINFYRHASGRYGQEQKDKLLAMCQATLSHPSESALAEAFLNPKVFPASPLELAWAYWALCWISRKGKGGTKFLGGSPSVRWSANGGNNATRLRSAAGDLENWAKQFERCEFESLDFRKLLPKVSDSESCGIYCDSPWVGAGKDYFHSFKDSDHRDLKEQLDRFEKSVVVVRYGDCELIRSLYASPGWRIIEASSRDQANNTKGELWILRNAKG